METLIFYHGINYCLFLFVFKTTFSNENTKILDATFETHLVEKKTPPLITIFIHSVQSAPTRHCRCVRSTVGPNIQSRPVNL